MAKIGPALFCAGLAGLLAVTLSGCASADAAKINPTHSLPLGTNAPAALAVAFLELGSTVDPAEASLLANTGCRRSLELAGEYHLVRPPLWHNLLINLGLKRRGLCYHWANDLTIAMLGLNLQTIELHRGVARLDTWREHSCVVVTAIGQPFQEGLVLDAWRHSGRLFWCRVAADKYPWIEVEIPEGLRAVVRTRSLAVGHKPRSLEAHSARASIEM